MHTIHNRPWILEQGSPVSMNRPLVFCIIQAGDACLITIGCGPVKCMAIPSLVAHQTASLLFNNLPNENTKSLGLMEVRYAP